MSQCLALVKAGYGSLSEVRELDTPDFLDCLEFLEINQKIENHVMERSKDGNGK